MSSAAPQFVTLEEAERIVREQVRRLPPRLVDWSQAAGRTLAAPVVSDLDMPPFDRAMMDGYAVRSADVAVAPVTLLLAGQIRAGESRLPAVGPGQAVQINTGAPLPPGADAVVRIEHTALSADGQAVRIDRSVAAGTSICPRGTYVRAGDRVLEPGSRFGPGELAVAATVGATRLSVYGAACVGLLVTGDELIDAERTPQGGQIRDSNGPLLARLLAEDGAEVTDLGRVGDDRELLTERVQHGLDHDVLCLTGGVSMGAFDFVPDVLAACGVRIHFQKMRTQPGRPTLFGTTEAGTLVFGLPGNPVSALVGYCLLVRPALAAMHGRDGGSRRHRAVLAGELKATGERLSFWPGRVTLGEEGRLVVAPQAWYGSGDPFGLRQANGLIVRAPHSADAAAGEWVEVVMTGWQEAG